MTFGMHPPQSVYIRINGDLGKETRKKSAKQLLKRKSRRRESCQTLKVLSWASEEGRLQREIPLIRRKHCYGHRICSRLGLNIWLLPNYFQEGLLACQLANTFSLQCWWLSNFHFPLFSMTTCSPPHPYKNIGISLKSEKLCCTRK